MTEDPRAVEARRLRVRTRLSLAGLRQQFGVSRGTVADWLAGEPTPEWTRRPNAKDAVRARALQLRAAGATVPAIAAQLNVSRSTAYRWVGHVPLHPPPEQASARRSEDSRQRCRSRWDSYQQ